MVMGLSKPEAGFTMTPHTRFLIGSMHARGFLPAPGVSTFERIVVEHIRRKLGVGIPEWLELNVPELAIHSAKRIVVLRELIESARVPSTIAHIVHRLVKFQQGADGLEPLNHVLAPRKAAERSLWSFLICVSSSPAEIAVATAS
jgi:hypothetical protein